MIQMAETCSVVMSMEQNLCVKGTCQMQTTGPLMLSSGWFLRCHWWISEILTWLTNILGTAQKTRNDWMAST
jgi:hypothetical protein